MSKPIHEALKLAVQRAGGQTALAEICRTKRQNIHQALQNERGLPASMVPDASKALGIPKHELRPDIFPRDETV